MFSKSAGPKGNRVRVLVLAADPVVAALLGLLLDPGAYEPVFPGAMETPEQALTRMRPRLVILLDAALQAAQSDLFFARTQRLRASVVVFQAPSGDPAATDVATRAPAPASPFRGEPAIVRLPTDREALSRVLEQVVADAVSSGLWTVTAVAGVVALVLGTRAIGGV